MDPLTDQTAAAVRAGVDDAAAIAQLFLPQFGAYILLGRAIARVAPALYNDAVALLHGTEPTAEQKADLMGKLQALAEPEKLRVES